MTIRRLLVFGVCAVGVAVLYAAPSLTRSPHLTAGPGPVDEPSVRASDRPSSRSVRPASSGSTPRSEARPASASAGTEQAQPADPQPSGGEPPRRGATAGHPASGAHDRVAPAPVRDIVTASVTKDRLTLSWPPADDNIAVTGYRVWLDGFAVATTTTTRATVSWFNNDAEQHVVQVKALDAAGNESPSSPTVLVARPTPQPDVPATTPAPPGSPAPRPPSSSATPTPEPSAAPPSTSVPVPSPSGAASTASQPGRAELVSSPQPSSSAGVR